MISYVSLLFCQKIQKQIKSRRFNEQVYSKFNNGKFVERLVQLKKNGKLKFINFFYILKEFSMVKLHLTKQRNSATECSICLMDIQNKAIIKECQHVYCFNCISEWIKSNKYNCPVCRTAFKSFYKIKEKNTKKIKKRILRERKHANDTESYQQIKIKTIHQFEKKNEILNRPIIQFITYPILYFPNEMQFYSNNLYFSPYVINPDFMQYSQTVNLY